MERVFFFKNHITQSGIVYLFAATIGQSTRCSTQTSKNMLFSKSSGDILVLPMKNTSNNWSGLKLKSRTAWVHAISDKSRRFSRITLLYMILLATRTDQRKKTLLWPYFSGKRHYAVTASIDSVWYPEYQQILFFFHDYNDAEMNNNNFLTFAHTFSEAYRQALQTFIAFKLQLQTWECYKISSFCNRTASSMQS